VPLLVLSPWEGPAFAELLGLAGQEAPGAGAGAATAASVDAAAPGGSALGPEGHGFGPSTVEVGVLGAAAVTPPPQLQPFPQQQQMWQPAAQPQPQPQQRRFGGFFRPAPAAPPLGSGGAAGGWSAFDAGGHTSAGVTQGFEDAAESSLAGFFTPARRRLPPIREASFNRGPAGDAGGAPASSGSAGASAGLLCRSGSGLAQRAGSASASSLALSRSLHAATASCAFGATTPVPGSPHSPETPRDLIAGPLSFDSPPRAGPSAPGAASGGLALAAAASPGTDPSDGGASPLWQLSADVAAALYSRPSEQAGEGPAGVATAAGARSPGGGPHWLVQRAVSAAAAWLGMRQRRWEAAAAALRRMLGAGAAASGGGGVTAAALRAAEPPGSRGSEPAPGVRSPGSGSSQDLSAPTTFVPLQAAMGSLAGLPRVGGATSHAPAFASGPHAGQQLGAGASGSHGAHRAGPHAHRAPRQRVQWHVLNVAEGGPAQHGPAAGPGASASGLALFSGASSALYSGAALPSGPGGPLLPGGAPPRASGTLFSGASLASGALLPGGGGAPGGAPFPPGRAPAGRAGLSSGGFALPGGVASSGGFALSSCALAGAGGGGRASRGRRSSVASVIDLLSGPHGVTGLGASAAANTVVGGLHGSSGDNAAPQSVGAAGLGGGGSPGGGGGGFFSGANARGACGAPPAATAPTGSLHAPPGAPAPPARPPPLAPVRRPPSLVLLPVEVPASSDEGESSSDLDDSSEGAEAAPPYAVVPTLGGGRALEGGNPGSDGSGGGGGGGDCTPPTGARRRLLFVGPAAAGNGLLEPDADDASGACAAGSWAVSPAPQASLFAPAAVRPPSASEGGASAGASPPAPLARRSPRALLGRGASAPAPALAASAAPVPAATWSPRSVAHSAPERLGSCPLQAGCLAPSPRARRAAAALPLLPSSCTAVLDV
jgi:hypothetical protein